MQHERSTKAQPKLALSVELSLRMDLRLASLPLICSMHRLRPPKRRRHLHDILIVAAHFASSWSFAFCHFQSVPPPPLLTKCGGHASAAGASSSPCTKLAVESAANRSCAGLQRQVSVDLAFNEVVIDRSLVHSDWHAHTPLVHQHRR